MERSAVPLGAVVLVVLALSLPGAQGAASQQTAPQWLPVPLPTVRFPDPSALPVQREFPDPLVMFDGRRVATREQWERERRPELKTLFQHYMYGYMPPPPRNTTGVVGMTLDDFFGGKATGKEVTISFGPPGCRTINLLLIVPNNRTGPAPVFLTMNYSGNHAVVDDRTVALPTTWVDSRWPGIQTNRATPLGRGSHRFLYAVERTIEQGYAFATFYYGDAFPDKPDFRDGIFPCFLRPRQADPGPQDWGAIAMWAWGLHRAVDYLVNDKDIDSSRVVVTGSSRLGKAALVAAAYDERIALVIPHQSCLGGVAPSRTSSPAVMTVSDVVVRDGRSFWFNKTFSQFAVQVDRLPFDQDSLVALVAPRPVLVTAGVDDRIDDPPGAFAVLRAADRVYRLLGTDGLAASEIPPLARLIDSTLGYYIRGGGHSQGWSDWQVFLRYADIHFRRSR